MQVVVPKSIIEGMAKMGPQQHGPLYGRTLKRQGVIQVISLSKKWRDLRLDWIGTWETSPTTEEATISSCKCRQTAWRGCSKAGKSWFWFTMNIATTAATALWRFLRSYPVRGRLWWGSGPLEPRLHPS